MSTTATNGSTPETGVPLDQAASASVAIDVGMGRGALVIYPAERFREREIEISPASLRATTTIGRTPAPPVRR